MLNTYKMKRFVFIIAVLINVSLTFSQNTNQQTEQNIAKNPVLPGFNPDPSILRVGNDYYLAVSTFQWFPGVTVYHSKDLSHWELLTNILTRKSQLDMMGVPSSGGIYAPQISFKNGTYYLVYTNIKGNRWPYMDGINYVVSAPKITGPWSEPVLLNAFGFDPSLFHDDNGKTYLLQNEVNFRNNIEIKAKIIMQEFDTKSMKLVGEKKKLSDKYAEGPHIYKHNGYYYLLMATGGTSYGHKAEMERSRNIWGPYENNLHNPVLTSQNDTSLYIQKAGHASLVQTPSGQWYMFHLGARPLYPEKQCPLGRETNIQKVEWTAENWLQLAGGDNRPKSTVEITDLPVYKFKALPGRYEFNEPTLRKDFFTLRLPFDKSWASFTARKGYLRLRGQLGLLNNVEQSLIARRVNSFKFTAETSVDFNPASYREMAGLICYYDSRSFLYLSISHDSIQGKSLNILSMDETSYSSIKEVLPKSVKIPENTTVFLRVKMNFHALQFYYSTDNVNWKPIGPEFNSTVLSDEKNYGFTGLMVGVCVQDLAYLKKYADFDYFDYQEQ